jgi:preprotein translocase subunit SecB
MSENENPVEGKEATAEESSTQERPQAGFAMEKVYVKDVSFESPNSPEIFTKEWKPEVKMDLNTRHKVVQENVHEVAVTVTLTASVAGMTAYIVEVQQAGLFIIQGIEGMPLHHTLGAVCPNLLFPYLRETIDTTVVKGGFQAVMLAPVNFDAIFSQAIARQQKEEQEAAAQEDGQSTVN